MTRRLAGGLLLVLVLLLGLAPRGDAQQTGPNDACRTMRTSPVDLEVGTGATVVVTADSARCAAAIQNNSALQGLRCRSGQEDPPTSTGGWRVGPGAVWTLGLAAQRGVRCTREGDPDGVPVSVVEYFSLSAGWTHTARGEAP